MPTRTYWLDLFSPGTWQEFLEAGGTVTGFRRGRWPAVAQIKQGDYLLCYLTQVSRLVGVLEVVSDPYIDESKTIWKDEDFPCRLNVRVVVKITVDTAVPIKNLSDRLSIFANLANPDAWSGHVRGSPTKWKTADGEAIVSALLEAQANPVVDPPPATKLKKPPKVVRTDKGEFTVPSNVDEPETETEQGTVEEASSVTSKEPTSHTEIQWRLLKLGNDMGLDVWVARNDRSRVYSGHAFANFPRLRTELPQQFDEVTNRTIELIDVLWLRKTAIVAAFEIESTTSIYSGLLRMSDLLSMQPNLNMPLYLVAPDERRNKVLTEVNRPTFSRLSPPLRHVCRYIGFSAIRNEFPTEEKFIRYLTPEFLKEYSESCEIEQP